MFMTSEVCLQNQNNHKVLQLPACFNLENFISKPWTQHFNCQECDWRPTKKAAQPYWIKAKSKFKLWENIHYQSNAVQKMSLSLQYRKYRLFPQDTRHSQKIRHNQHMYPDNYRPHYISSHLYPIQYITSGIENC